jgi:hypothetical protein
MELTGERERRLIERIAPVLLRSFEELASDWEQACSRAFLDGSAADVPGYERG